MKQHKRTWLWYLACIAFLLEFPAFAQKSGVSTNVLVLPTGPGSISGVGENVQANLNMGLMSYSIKIIVPKGRGSATPDLSVTYSSSAGAGLMGIGWSFSAGASVSRLTVRGLPKYDDTDDFYAGGELVKIPGTQVYRSRMEGGFIRYHWKQEQKDQKGYWVAEYPDGSKAYYGANSKGKINQEAQVTGFSGTFRWELVTMVDRNGNRIEYTYTKDASQTYIDRIQWVFDKQNKALYEVRLSYEERPDPISDGKPGFDVQTKKRLKEIQITSAGTRFRSYHFAYEDQTGLSRLIQVTRYGRDENKAYPVSFKMKYSDATLSKDTNKMVNMNTSLGIDFRGRNADFVDINGDGLPDVVDTSQPKHLFHLNTLKVDDKLQTTGHDFSEKKENPTETAAKLSNTSVQMLDFDGNGFTDMVDAVNKQIYLNFGNGRWEAQSKKLQNFPVTGSDPNMRFMDYDGDKKIDVISSDGTTTTYWLSDGQGNWTIKTGHMPIGRSFSKDNLRLIDINGDGLQDVVYITSDSLEYRKYLGRGNWSEWIKVTVPGMDKYQLDKQAQFSDINGDGMADMVAIVNGSIIYFANKNGREFAAGINVAGASAPSDGNSVLRIVDINGNGSRDIVWINSSGKVSYVELFNKRPNLMTEISNTIGQRINVEYGSSVNYFLRDASCDKSKDKACAGPWENKLPMAFQVVTKITTWASRSSDPTAQTTPNDEERPQIQNIYYHHGFYDGKEKKFRGFRHVETLFEGDDSVQNRKEEIKYDVGDKDTYMHGKLLEKTVSNGGDTTYHKLAMSWGDCPVELGGIDGKGLPFPIRYICAKAQEKIHIEGQSQDKWRVTRSEQTYDGFGNVITSTNLGEKEQQGDEQITKTTYISPQSPNDLSKPWLLRYPSKVEHCASTNGPCSLTEYYYDGEAYKGLPTGEISKGNVTRVRQRVSDNKFIEPTRGEYDEYGNLIGSKTALGLQRIYEWDATYKRFPSKETIQLDGYTLSAETTWDYALSLITRSIDFNGHVTEYTYDVFGRLLTVTRPGDDSPSIRHTYEIKAPISRIITEISAKKAGEFDVKVVKCIDGFGRTFARMRQIKDGTFQVSGHIEFNRIGSVATRWTSYQSDGTCQFTAPDSTPKTQLYYDGLGRNTKQVTPNGDEIRNAFEPLVRKQYDGEDTRKDSPHYNTPKTTIMDGLGRVIEEQTIPSKGQVIVKKFGYSNVNVDGTSLNTTVTLADGSIKTQEYDELGRLVKMTDPDRSTITYEYNDNGMLVRHKDARGVVTRFDYDGLNRIISRQQEGKDETKVTYSYDKPHTDLKEATNLKSKLARVTYPGGSRLYSYNERGQTILQRHLMMGHAFDLTHVYNKDGQLTQTTLPDGRTIQLAYDGAARLTSIPGKIKEIAYQNNGLTGTITFANGIATQYTYDKRLRPVKFDVASGKVFTLAYTLDATGNPLKIEQTHGDNSFTTDYDYDAAYRLLEAQVGNSETLRYQQDKLHNILSKVSNLGSKSPAHIGDYKYDEKRIHSTTQAGQFKLKYDQAGHMLLSNQRAFQWDYMGRMNKVQEGEKALGQFWYDDSSQRIIKEENGQHTFYINEIFQLREGAFVSYIQLRQDRVVGSWSVKGVEKFFDDVAPAKPDGVINAADAWIYHASREQIGDIKATLKKRPFDINMTRDMLNASIQRMLLDDKEVNHFYHTDHLGNVRAVTDDDGKVLQRKHYYPYGAIRDQSGNVSLFSYGFQGAEFDQSTQAWAFLKRSLNPQLGRWLSADPKFETTNGTSDEFNSYGMVENNPIAYRDIHGTSKIAYTFAALVGVALAGGGATAIYGGTLSDDASTTAFFMGGGAVMGAIGLATLGLTASIGFKQSRRNAQHKKARLAIENKVAQRAQMAQKQASFISDSVDASMQDAPGARRRSFSSRSNAGSISSTHSSQMSIPHLPMQGSVSMSRQKSFSISSGSLEGFATTGRQRSISGSFSAEGRRRSNAASISISRSRSNSGSFSVSAMSEGPRGTTRRRSISRRRSGSK